MLTVLPQVTIPMNAPHGCAGAHVDRMLTEVVGYHEQLAGLQVDPGHLLGSNGAKIFKSGDRKDRSIFGGTDITSTQYQLSGLVSIVRTRHDGHPD